MVLGQNPSWHMAAVPSQTTGSSSVANGSAIDAAGNVYLTGTFTGTVSFGPTSLTSAGGTDVFVAKWEAASNSFVWAQRGGGSGDDAGKSVAVQGSNVYVAGEYTSPQVALGSTVLNNQGTATGMYTPQDVFVAKLTDAGSGTGFTWALRVSGEYTESVAGLAVNGTNVYLAGQFTSSTLELGPVTLTNSVQATARPSTQDIFVTRLSDTGTSGTIAWAERAGGIYNETCAAMAVQGNDIYLHGLFVNYSGVATTTIGSITLISNGGPSPMFVAKLTDNGLARQWAWAVQAGNSDSNYPNGLAVYGTSVYVTGSFANQMPAGFGSHSLLGVGNMNLYLAKLTDAGSSASWTWARGNDSPSGSIRGYAVNASAAGVFLLADYYSTAVRLGSISLPSPASGQVVPIIGRLTDTGATSSYNWVQTAGNSVTQLGLSCLAVLGSQVYAAGGLSSQTATFGSYTVTVPNPSTPIGSRRAALLVGLTDNTILRSIAPVWAADLHLAPNPAHSRVAVTLPPLGNAKQVTLTLTDVLGRTVVTGVHAWSASGGRQELNLLGLTPGLYILHVQAGQQYAVRHLLVE